MKNVNVESTKITSLNPELIAVPSMSNDRKETESNISIPFLPHVDVTNE